MVASEHRRGGRTARPAAVLTARRTLGPRALACPLALALLLTLAPAAGAHVYWAEGAAGTIGRANLDGTGANDSFITGVQSPCGLAIDGSYAYWAVSSKEGEPGHVGRASLGTHVAENSFIETNPRPCGVAVDSAHVYYDDYEIGAIGRANLDGSQPNPKFIQEGQNPQWPAVDGAHVYWTNKTFLKPTEKRTIGRANLDGSTPAWEFITLNQKVTNPAGLAVDANYIYWGEEHGIGRVRLNGAEMQEKFIETSGFVCGVAVDAGHIYWRQGGSIGRANLDGTGVNNGFVATGGNGCGIAVDPGASAPVGGGGALRPTATQVICNYVVATSLDECFATVGDAGPPPATAPTGTVSFTRTGSGLFQLGRTCALTSSPSAPTTGSCSVDYLPGAGEGVPNISASYGGDSVHASSSGTTQFITPGDITTVSPSSSAPGQYPNTLTITTAAPAAGSDLSACALPGGPNGSAAQFPLLPAQSVVKLMEAEYAKLARQTTISNPQPATAGSMTNLIQELLAQPGIEQVFGPPVNATDVNQLDTLFTEIENLTQGGCQSTQLVATTARVRLASTRARHRRTRRVHHTVLASRRLRHAPIGRVKLTLKLSRARLNALAHGRKAISLLVPMTIVAPSARLTSGVPTYLVERVTLKRGAPHRRH